MNTQSPIPTGETTKKARLTRRPRVQAWITGFDRTRSRDYIRDTIRRVLGQAPRLIGYSLWMLPTRQLTVEQIRQIRGADLEIRIKPADISKLPFS